MGYAGFSQRFIKDFSTIAKPLINLLIKDVPLVLDQDYLNAFQRLKKALVSAPIIKAPDWTVPFEVMSDAKDYAIGIVLG